MPVFSTPIPGIKLVSRWGDISDSNLSASANNESILVNAGVSDGIQLNSTTDTHCKDKDEYYFSFKYKSDKKKIYARIGCCAYTDDGNKLVDSKFVFCKLGLHSIVTLYIVESQYEIVIYE